MVVLNLEFPWSLKMSDRPEDTAQDRRSFCFFLHFEGKRENFIAIGN